MNLLMWKKELPLPTSGSIHFYAKEDIDTPDWHISYAMVLPELTVRPIQGNLELNS